MDFGNKLRNRRRKWILDSRLFWYLHLEVLGLFTLLKKLLKGNKQLSLVSSFFIFLVKFRNDKFTFLSTKRIRRCMFSGGSKGQRFNVSRMSLKKIFYKGDFGSFQSKRW